jgi:predicted PurR-regulated permease PerM
VSTVNRPRQEVARPLFNIFAIVALVFTSLWIFRPFIGALIWATTIVVATWPLLLGLQRILWGRRGLAVVLLSAVLLGVLFVPFVLSIGAIVVNVDVIAAYAQSLANYQVPPLPAWVAGLPVVGARLARGWDQFVGVELQAVLAKGAPYAAQATKWAVAGLGGVGLALVQFLLTIVFAAILWTNGEKALAMVRRYARRLAGERGEASLRLAGQAIRGVALGIVVTALVQSLLGATGLLIARVPFVPLLTAVMFMLCIAQLGPFLVLLPASIWVFSTGSHVAGVLLLVWTVIVGTIDNFLRPILIRKGADLPLLLVFAGVIGGLISFGLLGIFVGPVVLAVTHTLAEAWAAEEPPG